MQYVHNYIISIYLMVLFGNYYFIFYGLCVDGLKPCTSCTEYTSSVLTNLMDHNTIYLRLSKLDSPFSHLLCYI